VCGIYHDRAWVRPHLPRYASRNALPLWRGALPGDHRSADGLRLCGYSVDATCFWPFGRVVLHPVATLLSADADGRHGACHRKIEQKIAEGAGHLSGSQINLFHRVVFVGIALHILPGEGFFLQHQVGAHAAPLGDGGGAGIDIEVAAVYITGGDMDVTI